MRNKTLFTSVLIGLAAGQIFAQGELPFDIVNTLRVGYDDNIERRPSKDGSAFVRDMFDLSVSTALSERTDLTVKSRLVYESDDRETNLNPNLYVTLTHSVSQRLLLQLSDTYRQDQVTSTAMAGRYDYYENTVSFTPSYVLSSVDRLSVPLSYTIERYDDAVDAQDTDIGVVGLSWKRDLVPQRTWAALNLYQVFIDYPNRDSSMDSTRLTAELSHTFNPEWQANAEIGASRDDSDFNRGGVNVTSTDVNPFLRLGLAYMPSPRTRFSGEFTHKYRESENSLYAGETTSEVRVDAQHEFTAKIKGKAWARYADKDYDRGDNETAVASASQENLELACYLYYKLNRINFLELGFKHRAKTYDNSARDWDSNRVELGWRVEL